MSDLSSQNILLNPLSEIVQALQTNSFGILPEPHSQPLVDQTFPIAKEDMEKVKQVMSQTQGHRLVENQNIIGKCKVGLLDKTVLVIRLDQSGWNLESIENNEKIQDKLGNTYESLETLLIDVSPEYVEAMNKEIWKRFEGHAQLAESEE
ncbi:uncharacterized protein L203_105851 [Cryptococcus depauperatus CBS 7841]|uniref:GSKIP domain-containing protein n=1 Tax=Cryptococcus depauperatus CBS 7841 TaxID=1295531 RepID=A0AAJ8M2X5_9TREE